MPEEKDKATPAPPAGDTDPKPAEGDAAKPADPAAPPTSGGGTTLEAEPLSDGTVPTVLAKGSKVNKDVPKGDGTGISSVYRKADITTTLITFVSALIVAGLIFGGYLYLNRSKPKATTSKVTTLDSADLSKLGAYFEGNAGGGASQILTINSSAVFKGHVVLNDDLKVTGALGVDGPTQLGDLTVNKTSTFGVTNIRGQLTVAGPLTLQSPATLSGGGTVTGNLTVSGNGSFGGSVAAGIVNTQSLAVTGNINLSGHLVINGTTPSVSANSGAGSGATVSIDGNDSDGTVTVNTGNIGNGPNYDGDLLVQINFKTAYGKVPRVLITAVGQNAGSLDSYVQKTNSFFIIGSSSNPRSNSSYTFDYWVVQ